MSESRRVKTRTQACDRRHARKRLADARKFLELADMVADPGVSAANAVLAGIAAADAACCAALGERSRSEDHRDATRLLALVTPGGAVAANALGRLLAVRNDAEYGLTNVSRAAREQALRQARKLVEFAETHLRR